MAFDQSTITAVLAEAAGPGLLVSWTSTAPEGTAFQVYLAGRLAWSGPARSVELPAPPHRVTIDVGAVAPGEERSDFSADLPARPGVGERPFLAWRGGTYLSPTLAGFNVYQGASPGAAVDYTTPVGTGAAYAAGEPTDGFGLGGFGLGGFGEADASYSWTGPPLPPGTWHFGVKPFDSAGTEGAASEVAVAISGPPRPPAPDASGQRLTYTYTRGGFGQDGFGAGDYAAPTLTLNWLAPPT